MFLLKSGVIIAFCMLIKAEVRGELGFNGLGSYHGGNDGHATSTYSSDEVHQNNNERQSSKVGVTDYSVGGLSNYASVSDSGNQAKSSQSFQGHQFGNNFQQNPIISPNLGLQSNVAHGGITFDQGWQGKNINYGNLNHGLAIAQTAIGRSSPKVIIPVREDTQHNGHLFTHVGQMTFPGLTQINNVPNFKNGVFLSNSQPSFPLTQDATFGLRIFPSKEGQGIYGQRFGIMAIGNGPGQVVGGAGHYSGGYQGSPALYGPITTHFPLLQDINHSFGQNNAAFTAGNHGQGVNHIPIGHIPLNQHINSGQGNFGNIGVENNYGNNYDHGTGNAGPASHEHQGTTTHDVNDVQNDVYSNQGGHQLSTGSDSSGSAEIPISGHTPQHFNSAQQDYTSSENKGSYHQSSQRAHHSSSSSQENNGDSVGSFGAGDTSQATYSSSEQKYLPSNDQGNSHTYDSDHNSLNSQSTHGQGSGETSSLVTNGHAVGNAESDVKATSFQSFVIHSYKPKRVYAKKVHKIFGGNFGNIERQNTHLNFPHGNYGL